MAQDTRPHIDKLPSTFAHAIDVAGPPRARVALGMDRARLSAGSQREAEWPIHGNPLRITPDEIARAARELVDAYGPKATRLMQNRTRAVRRRGDTESATLWFAIAQAVEEQLAGIAPTARDGGTAD